MQTNHERAIDPLYTALLTMDHQRRWFAGLCDALGFGPERTPYERLETASGASVRRYAAATTNGPTVVLVPAPIMTPDIWDLAPAASVVNRQCEIWPELLSWMRERSRT